MKCASAGVRLPSRLMDDPLEIIGDWVDALMLSLAAVAEMSILMREEDGKGSGGDIAVFLRNMIHKAGGDA